MKLGRSNPLGTVGRHEIPRANGINSPPPDRSWTYSSEHITRGSVRGKRRRLGSSHRRYCTARSNLTTATDKLRSTSPSAPRRAWLALSIRCSRRDPDRLPLSTYILDRGIVIFFALSQLLCLFGIVQSGGRASICYIMMWYIYTPVVNVDIVGTQIILKRKSPLEKDGNMSHQQALEKDILSSRGLTI